MSIQESIYFIGGSQAGSPVAYRVDGFTPTRISTHAVEDQWKENGVSIADAVGWWYLDEGHYFWVIWFPAGSAWVYDATEKQWAERRDWTGTAWAPYRPWLHAYLEAWQADMSLPPGNHIVCDSTSAKVFVMDLTYGQSEGVDIKRTRALPYLFSEGRRVFVGRVVLTQNGNGTAGPTIELAFSEDDGVTFSTPAAADLSNASGSLLSWMAPQGSFEYSAIPQLTVTGGDVVTLIELDAEISYGFA